MSFLKRLFISCCLFVMVHGLHADPNCLRVSNRQSNSFGYEYIESLPGGWSYYSEYYSETAHYLSQYPDVVNHLVVNHRRNGYGHDGLWHQMPTKYFNPQVTDSPEGRTIVYRITEGDNPATSNRVEVYDASNRLRTLSFMYLYNGTETGDRYHYSYLGDGRIDSIIKRINYVNISGYEKRNMQYDQYNRKSGEMIYTSSDSLQWAESRRVIIYQSGQDYPLGYSLRLHNPLDRTPPPGYARSYMYQTLPGVTNAGIVDSLVIQSFENGVWVDKFRDYYTIISHPDGTVSYNVLSLEIAYIGIPDYNPGQLIFSFNSAGDYTAQSFSTDDGLSPPYYQSIVYNWETGSDAVDTVNSPEMPLSITAYPNPFRDRIRISTKSASPATVSIYNLRGQKVWQANAICSDIDWDGRDDKGKPTATGVYIINLKHKDKEISRRILKY
ncbi:MAG: hypothetical protein CVU50_00090 [Candidatus Cloacimonetes bacterium HGW-Cloacimonetes-3]|jgi:hypothetical protein|nr:MAG: hypothetical protein CVU50_00090 [Candidatus Cloacimonetes bacterium HGW-Cloacimonetes-3]